ncbi:spermidine/putrescine transport system permease protein [Arboricoccus pini]|uniref:Spermidine/putrescine transport system permease protein n=1 Tax=Arboricoccus pini TaxID=1963835 RepID=A0A212RFV7_9PROT|nr:ABC transporter permease [Arboricoccus pini]SNB71245.1 spermidine/putrescine transport system permease protein [Arboricoccus pini]
MAFWAIPPILWQFAFFVVPLGFLVAMTFWSVRSFRLTPDMTLANWMFILKAGFFRSAYIYTFKLALLTALIASLSAFPAAYTLAFRLQPRTRRFLIFMLVVPFFTSYPVRIYSTQIFFSPEGIINAMIAPLGLGPVSVLDTPTGTVVGYLVLTLPLVLLLQTFALMNTPRDLIEAAHNLGCGRFRTILTVIVPTARVGLVLAATFAFVLSFGDYVAPLYLGGSNPPTLSILIADQVKSGNNWPRASVVAVTMILTLIVVMTAMLALAYGGRKKGRG